MHPDVYREPTPGQKLRHAQSLLDRVKKLQDEARVKIEQAEILQAQAERLVKEARA